MGVNFIALIPSVTELRGRVLEFQEILRKDIDQEIEFRVEDDGLEVTSADRWFSEGYTRGYWPRIRSILVRLIEEYKTVYYLPDNRFYKVTDEPITEERIKVLDELWASTGRESS